MIGNRVGVLCYGDESVDRLVIDGATVSPADERAENFLSVRISLVWICGGRPVYEYSAIGVLPYRIILVRWAIGHGLRYNLAGGTDVFFHQQR